MGAEVRAQLRCPSIGPVLELSTPRVSTKSTFCSLKVPQSPLSSRRTSRLTSLSKKQGPSACMLQIILFPRKPRKSFPPGTELPRTSFATGKSWLRIPRGRAQARSPFTSGAAGQSQSSSLQQTVSFEENKQARLPNGMLISYISADDVSFLYNEIWEERAYLQHGISIGPGNTVIDVGANIGLFTLQAAQACPGGRVVAFEPIPSTFAVLQRNVATNIRDSSSSASVKTINAGLSDGRLAEADFTFYEDAAGWSTMCQDDEEVQAAMEVFLSKALSSGEGLGSHKLAPLGKWLQERTPAPLFKRLSRLYVGRMLSRSRKVTCPLYTLSQIIADYELRQVDLLKIDVERAELDVLNGVQDSDWSKIKQVVLEVHDVNGRLDKVAAMLRKRGFTNLVQEQGSTLKDSALYNLFAKRL